jgi:Cof subfamily protein (haloacid dehalogenase superfamily)
VTATTPGVDRIRRTPGIEPGGRVDEWSPKRVRYVVCDVDGTLVGPTASASAEVVAAIARARSADLRVGYATGRMRDAVATLHDQLDAPGPHILHNGAEVRADGRTVAAWTLTHAQIDALLAFDREQDDCYHELYTSSGYLASSVDERARAHWDILGAEPRGIVRTAADVGDDPVLKATFAAFTPAAVDWVLERLATLDLEVGAAGSPLTPELSFINATRRGADKGAGLRRAAQYLDLDVREVAAIGDAANDLSMLAVAGTAIAMGQAPAAVRAAAHLVVPDVDAHGVAVALDALGSGALVP